VGKAQTVFQALSRKPDAALDEQQLVPGDDGGDLRLMPDGRIVPLQERPAASPEPQREIDRGSVATWD
jgi:hypothetical protein